MKKSNYPSRKRSSIRCSRTTSVPAEKGYILLIVMMMATILLISLAAAAPSIYVEGQREKEKELIFRGEQYARAIMLFHNQFNRYPTSVKELLHTNNMSFLRRAYPDPMTRSGKWRFIHATAAGVIIDSKILGPPGQQKNSPPSATGGPSLQSPAPQPNPQAAMNGQQGGGFQLGGFSLPGMGQSSSQSQQEGKSSFFGDNKMIGAFIVGVASTSHQQSIGVFDNRTEYDEWEFLGVPGAPGAPNLGGPVAVPGGAAQPGQTPGGAAPQPGAGGGFHLGPLVPGAPGPNR
ncbi:MAG TPA: type II secretion system protein [Terriglobia bacterium]|nr:type II secretion system protein [Terriglobia bacterium]